MEVRRLRANCVCDVANAVVPDGSAEQWSAPERSPRKFNRWYSVGDVHAAVRRLRRELSVREDFVPPVTIDYARERWVLGNFSKLRYEVSSDELIVKP
jgi:hypothetical protein